MQDTSCATPDRSLLARTLHGRIKHTALFLNTVVPGLLLFGVLTTDNLLDGKQLLDAALAMAVVVPVLFLAIMPLMGRYTRPLFDALDLVSQDQAVPPPLLEAARRTTFAQPWRSGLLAGILWGAILPAAFAIFLPGLPASSRQQVAIAGILLGPLMGFIILSAVELILRPVVALLFPDGGIAAYVGPQILTTRRRLVTSFVLLGPYLVFLLALLAYQRVATSASIPEALGHLPWVEGYFVVCAVLICFGLGQVVRYTLGYPIADLKDAMLQVEAGNLSVKLPVDNADSVGLMTDAYNQMVDGLQERLHLKDAFGRYVSPELASEVSAGRFRLGGQSCVATVMFTDIRNFTTISEQMDAEDLVAMLNRYFEAMVACIRAEGGSVNKFLGDGIMALFGAPAELAHSPLAAVRAALRMEGALTAFNAEQEALGLPTLAIGVGIATGQLVVGNVGSADRLEYTAIGDVVNTASRIEGLTKEFGSPVLLDERTYQAILGKIPVGMKGRVPVKGKSEPVAVYAPAVGTADLATLPALAGV